MPTYSFVCKECSHTFDTILKMVDYEKPLTEPCPQCKQMGCLKRQILSSSRVSDPTIIALPKEWIDFLYKLEKKNPRNANFKLG